MRLISVWWYRNNNCDRFCWTIGFHESFRKHMCKTRANGHGSLKKYGFFAKAVKKSCEHFHEYRHSYLIFVNIFSKMKMWTIFAKLSNFMFSRIRTNAVSFKPYYLYKQKTDRNFQTCLGIARPWLEWPVVFCKFKNTRRHSCFHSIFSQLLPAVLLFCPSKWSMIGPLQPSLYLHLLEDIKGNLP